MLALFQRLSGELLGRLLDVRLAVGSATEVAVEQAVFIALLFGTWLWGIWGMLLSIPIIVIVKVVSEHVEQLEPVAELLGDENPTVSRIESS